VSLPVGIALFVAILGLGAAAYFFRASRQRDDTIRRQQAREAALKARFDDVFARVGDIVMVHDRRGRLATINRAGEHAVGYSRDELRVLDLNWIVGPDYLDTMTQMLAEGVDAAPRSFRSTLSARRGERVPVDVHARVVVADDQLVGVTCIARDLTEHERLENELRQAQKMEAVGRLATGVAHDFNNIITVLMGYSDELIEDSPEGSPVHRSAVEVRRAADRASALTQQLLAFSRRNVVAAHTVDLTQVVSGMSDLIRRLIGSEIRLECTLQPDLAKISGDSAQIGQVLMNLVVNARDAMPEGGTLSISTANVVLGNEHLDVIPGPHVRLTVADTGSGMTADVRDRVFEPFFTTKGTGQGTGLGLSMVQAIVRQRGGHIAVESHPGVGTQFHVFFPQLLESPTIVPPVAEPSVAVAIRGQGVVLLAEDDVSVRRLVVSELGRRGYTVLEAEDGRAALEVLQREKNRVDLLLTDVVMPRMNGVELAKEAARLQPGLKVLFISGHPERAGAGLDPTGIPNLLMKPFTAERLAMRIKDTLEEGTPR
jgi:PAS domain S-box-containing protein